jgi:hypothetical protein
MPYVKQSLQKCPSYSEFAKLLQKCPSDFGKKKKFRRRLTEIIQATLQNPQIFQQTISLFPEYSTGKNR